MGSFSEKTPFMISPWMQSYGFIVYRFQFSMLVIIAKRHEFTFTLWKRQITYQVRDGTSKYKAL